LSSGFAAQPVFADFSVLNPAPTNPAAVATPTNAVPVITNAMDALDGKYRLAIGDRLSFRVVEDEEDPKQLFVTDSGDLEVPLLGRFPALGRTCKELAQALKKEFERDYYYNATVIIAVDVMTRARGRVYLVGPVRSPGPQEVPSDETLTVSKAIMRAGGFGDFADKKNVKITRKGTVPGQPEQSFIVDVAEILERGRVDRDLPLEPGDLIYIPERLIRF
jgi:polysaccharide export outer membrane protein